MDRAKIHRVSRRDNGRLNHAIRVAVVTQSGAVTREGGTYYDREVAEGHSGNEVIGALKPRISDALRDGALPDTPNSPPPWRSPVRGATIVVL